MPTLITTPGASNANSYADLDQAADYFDGRAPIDPVWVSSGSERYMVMSTRGIDTQFQGRKTLVRDSDGKQYYITSRAWTGAPASAGQALAWPRTGMYDRLGRAIASDVIPAELVEATCEFAGQLRVSDRTLDSDIKVQGITSVKAGSVAVTFKNDITTQVIPDAVLNMMPPSWFTDEIVTYVRQVVFESLG